MEKQYLCFKMNEMATTVFVSHASADQQIVSMFVEEVLISGMGLRSEEVFYSSDEDTGVENGKDIPEAIRTGLLEAKVFIMMVSDSYRRSEVCLNEMGAAWIRDDLLRIILLLPGTGFDRMGWLVSLKKGTRLEDSDGLDGIYDQMANVLKFPRRTATWNRHKKAFISSIESNQMIAPKPSEEADDEESSFLDDRDCFDENIFECIRVMGVISSATSEYSTKVRTMSQRLNRVNENPKNLTTQQIRGILHQGSIDTDSIVRVIEENTPILQERFTNAMDAGIRIHQCDFLDETVKTKNRQQCGELVEAMTSAKEGISSFRESLTKVADLDKDFRRSKKRLIIALDGLLVAISSCISKAGEYQVL